MIRWISDQLGTAPYDFVKDISSISLVDVRDLVDKEGNNSDVITSKIDQAIKSLDDGKKTVICCDYGMSRSNSIAAGVIAKREGIHLSEAVRKVLKYTGEKSIKIEVVNSVRKALAVSNERSKTLRKDEAVLITGASGFVGDGLSSLLAEKGVKTLTPSREEINLLDDIVQLDLFVREHNVREIIHLAHPRIFSTNEAMGRALLMLKNVLDVAVENNIKLIFPSTWEVFSGYPSPELMVKEDFPLRPSGCFGQTKMLCQDLIHNYQSIKGLKQLTLRMSSVYGLGRDKPRFLLNFMKKAKCGERITTHKYINGLPALDLLHINDLHSALVLATGNDLEGTINIGSGRLIFTQEVAELLVSEFNSTSNIRQIDINSYVGNIVLDITQAQKLLDWEPVVDITKGLRELANG